MNLSLTAEHLELQAATRAFAVADLAPTAAERERAHEIPHAVIGSLGERGLLGVNIPRALGGAERGVVAYAVALREIAAADASVAVTMAVTNMVGEVITRFGTPDQRRRYVPKLTSGAFFGGAFALSEPGAGSDAASLRTRAERRGDRWILNGEKMWITTGDQAGVIVVWARTDPPPERGSGHRGISCFLVDAEAPGLSAGKPEDKMGLRASHTVALSLADVEVPSEALLGREGQGFTIAMVALDGGRIGIGAQSCGIGGAALDAARDHALRHEQFGAPIAQQAAIQAQLADVATELDAAWLLVLRAAWLKEAIAAGRREGRFSREAAMAKVFASEAANRAVRCAVHMYGGRGYMEDDPVARYFRDCRVAQIYEGTSEVQRMVIARDLLHGG